MHLRMKRAIFITLAAILVLSACKKPETFEFGYNPFDPTLPDEVVVMESLTGDSTGTTLQWTVAWDDMFDSSLVESILLYRDPDGSTWNEGRKVLNRFTTQAIDNEVQSGQTYSYWIRLKGPIKEVSKSSDTLVIAIP